MKIVVFGGNGFVAQELIRQSLNNPSVTCLVVLSRSPVKVPEGLVATKLRPVVVGGYDEYPESIRREFTCANACIWTVGITPGKAKSYDFEEVRRMSETYPLAGLRALVESNVAEHFRFLYMSGDKCERDQTKPPALIFGKFLLMRGEVENKLLSLAEQYKDKVQLQIVKPAFIFSSSTTTGLITITIAKVLRSAFSFLVALTVEEAAAAMLSQVLGGFEKETLDTKDMLRLSKKAVEKDHS
ncbi:hypothetical protein EDB81DRAFT_808657 [Dactylonectria macrodidyma]|uniref:NAD(P)-binding domain-containing protein n=1 Tax=Dactylonectria macrodidyma TaxID=307937 RepID=A0A9P9INH9_9HYPO|nr:hypothetical protein EDB81DRAFT_808657 [Dactylonectria macrodidyma]